MGSIQSELHLKRNKQLKKGFCLDPFNGPGQRDEACKRVTRDPLPSEGSFYLLFEIFLSPLPTKRREN
jgi:hypothetical protein